MIRAVAVALITLSFASCGGSSNRTSGQGGSKQFASFAQGPISRACLAADRRAASPQLCGCVQAVANDMLSTREQSRAVRFFNDPQRAQDTRQSGSSFWPRYKAFAAQAEEHCKPVSS